MTSKRDTARRWVHHRTHDTCLGTGFNHLDKYFCGADIVTTQYFPEGTHFPKLRHYHRCPECTAALFQATRREEFTRKWTTGQTTGQSLVLP